ncbi:MAG TPA: CBS domain-containing protein [Candidatus Woesearchaeota archaeon]|nr:MAG: hypothetical protein DRJ22_02480 [Candidatus Woesearchaeota archaeon]HDD70697.1 CBS domain-containing protein [Candidatus Woesearchaeota archaeon]
MISKCYLVEPFVCNENDSIADVAKKLKEYAQRHIFVVNDNKKPVGIISVTDILDKIVVANKNVADFKAKDIMNKDILVFDDSEQVKGAYKAMVEKKITSCAICDHDKGDEIIGILTLKEALRCLTSPEHI